MHLTPIKTKKQTTILVLSVFLFCVMGKDSEGKDTDRQNGKPNILFIVSDDHGWGDLASNWDKTEVRAADPGRVWRPKVCGFRTTIPSRSADRLAPACLPVNTRRKTACGAAPEVNRSDRQGYRGIKHDVKTLPEHLAEAGYKTGSVWQVAHGLVERERFRMIAASMSFAAFSEGRTPIGSKGITIKDPAQPGTRSRFRRARDRIVHSGGLKKFIRRERRQADDPFFCYLAYNAVHGPLRTDESKPASAPEAWVKKGARPGCQFPAQ